MANFESRANFCLIVWKSTTSIGRTTVGCSGGGPANSGPDIAPWFRVCNYSPAGNSQGKFGASIAKPRELQQCLLPSSLW
jgi:hypothetical protein